MNSPHPTIVSNRLPVTVAARGSRLRMTPSSGGLAAGLRAAHERGSGSWIGWPGDTSALLPDQRERLSGDLERQRLVPIDLSADDVRLYYVGFSNGVVWPLFHYLLDRTPIDGADWQAYWRVNRTFDHDSRARLHVTGTADVRRLLEIIVRDCEREVAQPARAASP